MDDDAVMLPPWLQPRRPRREGDHAFDRDPDRSETGMHLELLGIAVLGAIVWLVVVGFFSLLFQSVWPAVIGAILTGAAFVGARALWRRMTARR